MMLEEANQSAIVPFVPPGRRRSHDDSSQSVLEQQPSARGTRQRFRREVIGRPGAGESLLSKRPEMTTPVPDLTRERTSVGASVRTGSRDDELVEGCGVRG